MGRGVLRVEEPAAHHRRRRQRHHERDEDRRRQRHRELPEEPADDPAHQQDGDEHGHQREAHRQDGEADLLRAEERRPSGGDARLHVPGDVLEDDDGVVDDEPRRDRQGHQREVVQAVPQEIHDAEGSDQRHRYRHARDERGADTPQEGEDDQDHEQDRDQERQLDIPQRRPDRGRPVEDDREPDRRRDGGRELRDLAADAIDRLDDVRGRLPEHDQQHGRLAVHQPRRAEVLHRVLDTGDVGQPHGGARPVGDDQGRVLRGGPAELVVGLDLPGPAPAPQLSLRPFHVGGRERGADVLEADPVLVQGRRVQLHPDGRERAAPHEHLADALDLGELLLEDRRRRVVHLALAHGVGGEGQDENRRVGRIHLSVCRVARQVRRQVAPCRVDRRLDVAGGAVDIPAQVELQDDAGRSEVAGRRHLGHARDAAELALEGGGHRGRHGLGARPRQARRDRDRGEFHLGQGRHGEQPEGDQPREGQSPRQERRRHGPGDEGRRDVHACPRGRVPAPARRASRSNAR